MSKPHLFIGSSGKEIDTARNIASVLSRDPSPVRATAWNDGDTFTSTRSTLDNLIRALEFSEFGAFIFAPDDFVVSKDIESHRARDNVVFESGLFVGRFGQERTFLLHRRDPKLETTLPSDLHGIGFISFNYDANRPSESVAHACTDIRNAVQRVLTAATPPPRASSVIQRLDLELSERQLTPLEMKLSRNESSKVFFLFTNPTHADVKLLHICFPPEIDMNFLPWNSQLKETDDTHAANLRYFWLTKDQLQSVTRPHGFTFLLHGHTKGTYQIKVVAKVGSFTKVEPVTVVVS